MAKKKAIPQEHVTTERVVSAEELRDKDGHFVAPDADGKTETASAPAVIADAGVTRHVKATVDVYYLVNPGGAIHEVTKDHARARLAEGRGWRMAMPAEIAQLKKQKGNQVADAPICKPWTAEPEMPAQDA